ncbi:TIGR03668 family PPOX class F420-dependent oxidoreductase [Gryllotalpicola reticulitermitis]|uniref:TIGR03668 family PPOX class F420-dependent oxidoreductase n=1 Tax=Gryllotalpicola reticulitermitis TaxID=1184153 RepID=A0ABV8Q5R7_9MICO
MRLGEDEARSRFAAARVARLATVTGEGAPRLVPITFAVEGDLIYTAVDHKPKTTRRLSRLGNIAQNPRVALLTDEYAEDWSRLWWVRVDGVANVVTDAGGLTHPIDALVARYEQYAQHRPQGPLIVIRATGWTGWAAA